MIPMRKNHDKKKDSKESHAEAVEKELKRRYSYYTCMKISMIKIQLFF